MSSTGGEKERGKNEKTAASPACSSCSLAGTRYCITCSFNPDKRAVEIRSVRSSEFTSDIVVDGVRYHVQTEKLGPRNPVVVTSVLKGGEIISSKKVDCRDLLGGPGSDKKLVDLMQRQHLAAIKSLKEANPRAGKIPSAYLEDVKGLLRENRHKAALKMLRDALTEHPFNPFLLSYYGCLDAIVDNNYERGIETCENAIEILTEEVPFGRQAFYPVFYLNLGRACLAAGKKKDAAEAFKKGLASDPRDPDLLMEARKLGTRRKPAIPFLKRSNPMNKYIGILLRKLHTD